MISNPTITADAACPHCGAGPNLAGELLHEPWCPLVGQTRITASDHTEPARQQGAEKS